MKDRLLTYGTQYMRPIRAVAVVVGMLVLAQVLGADTPAAVIALGSIVGLTYGLLAVGLVLVYRGNKIINFAHGEVGAFASAIFGLLTAQYGLPYYLILPLALLIGAGVGALTEVSVIRRLRKAPKLMSIVATLGVGQFLLLFGFVVNAAASNGQAFPEPPGLPAISVFGFVLTPAYVAMLVLAPLAVIGLAAFLKYTKYGLGIRAAAANEESARMAAIPASRMSSLTWALAGALSALTAVLTQPTRGFTTGETFGPDMLLRALVVGVIARMESLPVALAAGVGLGVVEQLLLWNYPGASLVEVVIFVLILATLLLQRRRGGREEEKGTWAAVQAIRPVPEVLRQVRSIRNLAPIVATIFFALAAALPLFTSSAESIRFIAIIGVAAVGLSVSVITGLAGQLSLGQFAVAAVGAWASYMVSSRIGHFELAFLYAGFAGALVSLVIGLPALRIKGLFLTVTTLSFALVMPAYFLPLEGMLGSGVNPGRPVVGDLALDNGRLYFWFALPVFALMTLMVWNVRRGAFGRMLLAVRDNEDAARSFTIPVSLVKVQGFLLAGFVAGVGGALYGHALTQINAGTFPTALSIAVVTIAVIGGISLTAGPLIGALFVIGVPAFLPLDSAGLAATALGQLLVILYLPSGLGGLVEPIRDRIVKFLGRRAGYDVDAIYAQVAAADGSTNQAAEAQVRTRELPIRPAEQLRPAGAPILEVAGLAKSFGGVHAVRGVTFDVRSKETLGLIGPNGAGKTTTFELLGGFTKADRGQVRFQGQDVTGLTPEARGRLGLIRSFQDAALFSTLTVRETVRLALERDHPTAFLPAVLGLPAGERAKAALVDDLLDFMGLNSYRASQIRELSTGTRRITEIACLVALRPTLLLLDEPSSGVAQRETEALGSLLVDLKEELDLTLVVIEHDIPLVMELSDRIIAMADGELISAGSPEHVRHDPVVVESYLGGSDAAIERSDAGSSATVRRPAPAPA